MSTSLSNKIFNAIPIVTIFGICAFLSVFFNKVSVENKNLVNNLVNVTNHLNVECNPIQNTDCYCSCGDSVKNEVMVKNEHSESVSETSRIESSLNVEIRKNKILGFNVKDFVMQVVASTILGLNLVLGIGIIFVAFKQREIRASLEQILSDANKCGLTMV